FDFRNAFNCVSRQSFLDEVAVHFPSLLPFVSLCYGSPSVLQFGSRQVLSTRGVQQGDPLGPFLFCLAIRPVLARIQAECDLRANCWYLDDGFVVGRGEEVQKALRIVQSDGPLRGLHLNTSKSEVWSSSGTFLRGLADFRTLSADGFEILGTPVGSPVFCQTFLQEKMHKFRSLWAGISKLPHLQTQALLLRFCSSFCKIVHLVRTVPPHLVSEGLSGFDSEFGALMETVTGPTSEFTWAFMTLGCQGRSWSAKRARARPRGLPVQPVFCLWSHPGALPVRWD